MSEAITDKIGQPIAAGSIIAYGHALGRCAGIRIGKVLKLSSKPSWREGETEYRITVQGVDDDWDHKTPALTSRVGTLQFPERIIVLAPEAVPAKFRKLLDGVEVKP
jgi:hypothetical protein